MTAAWVAAGLCAALAIAAVAYAIHTWRKARKRIDDLTLALKDLRAALETYRLRAGRELQP
jgi:hypothetical protein